MERKIKIYYYTQYNTHSFYDDQKIHEKVFDNLDEGVKWLNENSFIYHNHVFAWVKNN